MRISKDEPERKVVVTPRPQAVPEPQRAAPLPPAVNDPVKPDAIPATPQPLRRVA